MSPAMFCVQTMNKGDGITIPELGSPEQHNSALVKLDRWKCVRQVRITAHIRRRARNEKRMRVFLKIGLLCIVMERISIKVECTAEGERAWLACSGPLMIATYARNQKQRANKKN